ncbi:HAD family hydrolase [Stackebrandtia nassauensis]|uniref:HAD family hydrolase n=1 Tax=Stackebrandtia nassauensis TaxID=283811 RepID=UPI0001A3A409|nr:HAD family hydrolase [Stackebrandtia nassauensis]
MDIEVIATDLDGTLLDDEGRVSARTVRTLGRVRARGVAVVAVTARPPRVFDEWRELGGVVDAAICSNGGLTYVPGERRVESVRALDAGVAAVVVKALRAVVPSAAFAVETGFTVLAEPGYGWVDSVGHRRQRVGSFEEVLVRADQIVKLLMHDAAGRADEMVAAVRAAGVDGVEVSHSGGSGLVEMCAAGVSKATALERWCAGRGVGPQGVVAFGDAPNDVPMLSWAGRSFAMADAHAEAVAAASGRAGSNNADGVARVVEALVG